MGFFSVFEPNLEPPNQPPWHWPCWSAPCAQWVFPPIPKTQRKKMSICNGLVGKINLKPWFWPPVVWGSDSPLQSWDGIQIIQIQNIISVYISMALCLCNKPEKKNKNLETHTHKILFYQPKSGASCKTLLYYGVICTWSYLPIPQCRANVECLSPISKHSWHTTRLQGTLWALTVHQV